MAETTIPSNVIIEEYPVFETNQVLLSKNLNDLRDYLEKQNRLTRAELIGKGIVSGLEVTLMGNTINVSAGIGVTSLGYIVSLPEDKTFIDYKDFKVDNEKEYLPFWREGIHIELKELCIEMQPVEQGIVHSKLQDIWDDMVVMVFIQFDDLDIEPCFSQNCDDKGTTRRHVIRFLLIKKVDILADISNTNNPQVICQEEAAIQLPLLRLKEFRFPSQTPESFQNNYKEICNNDFLSEISTAFKQSYTEYKEYLDFEYQGDNPFNGLGNSLKQKKTRSSGNMQYFYDFLSDLIRAYDEFKEIAYGINNNNTVDMVFERHMCLGLVHNTDLNHQLLSNRHHFQKSLRQFRDIKTIQKLILFHKRIVILIAEYNPDVLDDELLKITPGAHKHKPLGEQAIPFYYKPANGEGEIEKYWNPCKCMSGSWVQNLSYYRNNHHEHDHDHHHDDGHHQDDDRNHNHEHNQNHDHNHPNKNYPLKYRNDKYGFLRIEGYIGMEKEEMVNELELIRKQNHLSFDIKPLSLNPVYNSKDDIVEYLKKHAGIKHLGGVEVGGTFIPVFKKSNGVEKVVGGFSLPYVCCEPELTISMKVLNDLLSCMHVLTNETPGIDALANAYNITKGKVLESTWIKELYNDFESVFGILKDIQDKYTIDMSLHAGTYIYGVGIGTDPVVNTQILELRRKIVISNKKLKELQKYISEIEKDPTKAIELAAKKKELKELTKNRDQDVTKLSELEEQIKNWKKDNKPNNRFIIQFPSSKSSAVNDAQLEIANTTNKVFTTSTGEKFMPVSAEISLTIRDEEIMRLEYTDIEYQVKGNKPFPIAGKVKAYFAPFKIAIKLDHDDIDHDEENNNRDVNKLELGIVLEDASDTDCKLDMNASLKLTDSTTNPGDYDIEIKNSDVKFKNINIKEPGGFYNLMKRIDNNETIDQLTANEIFKSEIIYDGKLGGYFYFDVFQKQVYIIFSDRTEVNVSEYIEEFNKKFEGTELIVSNILKEYLLPYIRMAELWLA